MLSKTVGEQWQSTWKSFRHLLLTSCYTAQLFTIRSCPGVLSAEFRIDVVRVRPLSEPSQFWSGAAAARLPRPPRGPRGPGGGGGGGGRRPGQNGGLRARPGLGPGDAEDHDGDDGDDQDDGGALCDLEPEAVLQGVALFRGELADEDGGEEPDVQDLLQDLAGFAKLLHAIIRNTLFGRMWGQFQWFGLGSQRFEWARVGATCLINTSYLCQLLFCHALGVILRLKLRVGSWEQTS
jgi:hypothetical protein